MKNMFAGIHRHFHGSIVIIVKVRGLDLLFKKRFPSRQTELREPIWIIDILQNHAEGRVVQFHQKKINHLAENPFWSDFANIQIFLLGLSKTRNRVNT